MAEGHRLVRQYLVEELKRDLVGPERVNEELEERPTSRYLTGILYPKDSQIAIEEDQDSGEATGPDEGMDQGVVMATTTNPSAIGMTFTVATGTEIEVLPSAAIYLESSQAEGHRDFWRRQPVHIAPEYFKVTGDKLQRIPLTAGLMLMVRFRKPKILPCGYLVADEYSDRSSG